MQPNYPSRIVLLSAFSVTSLAIVGYFVGLQSPMNPAEKSTHLRQKQAAAKLPAAEQEVGVIPATSYTEMSSAVRAMFASANTSHTNEPLTFVEPKNGAPQASQLLTPGTAASEPTKSDSVSDPQISIGEKRFALAMRQRNRAFNGAPPTVPHPIAEVSAEACIACHLQGTQSATLRASKMSHQFLANCTQCHVGVASPAWPNALVRENHFVGLPAPENGPRAFAGAPPQIPHSTWMRIDCLSCHGSTSYRGLQTTHPWRQNCQQCHAPSSVLEQTQLESKPKLIDPPSVEPL